MDDWQKWQSEAFKGTVERNQEPQNPETFSAGLVLLGALTLLAILQIYTWVRLSRVRESLDQRLAAQSDPKEANLRQDLEKRVRALERAYERTARSQKGHGVPDSINAVAGRVDSTQEELKRSISATQKLRQDHERTKEELDRRLEDKADQSQIGALSQDVSETRGDLNSAKKKLEETVAQLGMTRSELGTLIARNHEEIGALRALGERDYFEFTLNRSHSTRLVAGLGLQLKRVDVGKMHYTLDVYADDRRIEKKDRGINEPVFFYVRDKRQPIELVVNEIEKDRVAGYLSALKGTMLAALAKPDTIDDPDWEPFKQLKKQKPLPISQKAPDPSAAGDAIPHR